MRQGRAGPRTSTPGAMDLSSCGHRHRAASSVHKRPGIALIGFLGCVLDRVDNASWIRKPTTTIRRE